MQVPCEFTFLDVLATKRKGFEQHQAPKFYFVDSHEKNVRRNFFLGGQVVQENNFKIIKPFLESFTLEMPTAKEAQAGQG